MRNIALKSLDKHLTRTMWGLCAVYWILIFHPVPNILKLIVLMIWCMAISFSIGILVADRKIYKANERNNDH
jgi:hypothetical protein